MTECLKCGTSWDAPVPACPQCNSIPPTTLRQLSDAATPGTWVGNPARLVINTEKGKVEGPVMSYLIGNKASAPGTVVSLASERHADHHFVAALVNAYRAGELVERGSGAAIGRDAVLAAALRRLISCRVNDARGIFTAEFISACKSAETALNATDRHGVLDD